MNSCSFPGIRSIPSITHAFRAVAVLSVIALSACASSPVYHSYLMRGQVLSVDGNSVTVCVGERDGAKSGQVFDEIRHVALPTREKQIGPTFRRDSIGTVRIATLFDDHYATAEVLKGDPMINDTVELNQPSAP